MKSNLIERIQVFGIDLGKNTFHVCAMDASGHVVLSKQFTRARLKEQLVQLPICTVALEACAGAHYWGRLAQRLGHTVRLISPQFVTPYAKSNKTDTHDAEAICEAATCPTMRFVAVKTIEQQG